jgi:hypothetical protein
MKARQASWIHRTVGVPGAAAIFAGCSGAAHSRPLTLQGRLRPMRLIARRASSPFRRLPASRMIGSIQSWNLVPQCAGPFPSLLGSQELLDLALQHSATRRFVRHRQRRSAVARHISVGRHWILS